MNQISPRRGEVTEWARGILAQDIVILDTETTGLWPEDEIVEIAAISRDGAVLINQRIQPIDSGRLLKRDKRGTSASDIHGILPHMLEHEPRFPEVYPRLQDVLFMKPVIIYNAAYDTKMLAQDYARHHLAPPLYFPDCAMLRFAEFWGEENTERGGYRWCKLELACSRMSIPAHAFENHAHSALGDCLRTLALLKALAASG
ncbi:MAG TPA: 3'-5' exonuclease [Candidatus Limnocylindrales bacterium]|nr:3'-5' exonuclease [Candidatus Limnocylindrales bacterium]